jgi:DNA-3-methyladenine glycosylase
VFDRSVFEAPATEVAPQLLGGLLMVDDVVLRITEVEAYLGIGVGHDPGSHAFRGKGVKNATMFGPPGHLYTYFTYGMHVCANVVCSPEGSASGVLLRAGEIVDGIEIARMRRLTSRKDSDLARGPARLTVAMGITLADDGADLSSSRVRLQLPAAASTYETSPRTGVSGAGGQPEFAWRFYLPGEPSVSPYKAWAPKKRD